MKQAGDGFNSPTCTWPRCRRVLDYGSAVQVKIKDEEHRLCSEHHSIYMNGDRYE